MTEQVDLEEKSPEGRFMDLQLALHPICKLLEAGETTSRYLRDCGCREIFTAALAALYAAEEAAKRSYRYQPSHDHDCPQEVVLFRPNGEEMGRYRFREFVWTYETMGECGSETFHPLLVVYGVEDNAEKAEKAEEKCPQK